MTNFRHAFGNDNRRYAGASVECVITDAGNTFFDDYRFDTGTVIGPGRTEPGRTVVDILIKIRHITGTGNGQRGAGHFPGPVGGIFAAAGTDIVHIIVSQGLYRILRLECFATDTAIAGFCCAASRAGGFGCRIDNHFPVSQRGDDRRLRQACVADVTVGTACPSGFGTGSCYGWAFDFGMGQHRNGFLGSQFLAAYRAGIRTILIPEENKRDISDVPEEIRGKINFVVADNMNTVLSYALVD